VDYLNPSVWVIALQLAISDSAVRVPERLWEFAPSAGQQWPLSCRWRAL